MGEVERFTHLAAHVAYREIDKIQRNFGKSVRARGKAHARAPGNALRPGVEFAGESVMLHVERGLARAVGALGRGGGRVATRRQTQGQDP